MVWQQGISKTLAGVPAQKAVGRRRSSETAPWAKIKKTIWLGTKAWDVKFVGFFNKQLIAIGRQCSYELFVHIDTVWMHLQLEKRRFINTILEFDDVSWTKWNESTSTVTAMEPFFWCSTVVTSMCVLSLSF